MKVFLVGDNINYLNWGARGASIALFQMLSQVFEIIGTTSTDVLSDSCGYVNTFLPRKYHWIFRHSYANRHRRSLFDLYHRVEEFFGAKDFLAHDPAETADTILKHRHKSAELQELYEKTRRADLVVVNGEGDLVFTAQPRRTALFLLGMTELALRLGKRVVFVNALVSDCPVTGRNNKTLQFARRTLSNCDAVIVRDYQSLRYVRAEMPSARASFIPDALFSWLPLLRDAQSNIPGNGDFVLSYPEARQSFGKLDFSEPYICVGGSALAGRDRDESIKHFSALLFAVNRLRHNVYVIESCEGDSFLRRVAAELGVGLIPGNTAIFMCAAILANARLLISGRYHPSILASLGGTPCIFLGSSAHKMLSLQEVLEYEPAREFPLYRSTEETEELVSLASHYLDQGEDMRQTIRAIASKRCDESTELPHAISRSVGSQARPTIMVRPSGAAI